MAALDEVAQAPRLSVVIPVLDDAEALTALLRALDPASHPALEVIVVDASSGGRISEIVGEAGARWIPAPRGRGHQLRMGSGEARGRWLWFLHADTQRVEPALRYLLSLSRAASPAWGRFDVAFDVATPLLRVVAAAMNARSRLSGICTGDQGMFLHRDLLSAVGGVPAQSLMEDVELSARLRRLRRPRSRRETLVTSARRWRAHGPLRTVLRMWWFRLRYWLGADPERLAREYYR
ncbi:MAG: TIGR04283 family arsenosugar biosynthesis glycosyltransferase [Pseudomonadota bacterium]